MFNYDSLAALNAVVKERSFSKAAKVLFITQPALSQKIKNLEIHVGSPLLLRRGPIRPTDIGKKLVIHFRQVEQLAYDVEENLLGQKKAKTPLAIPIALNTESLATWFMDAVKNTVKQENIVLELHVDDQERTDRLVRAGKVIGCVTSISKTAFGCTSTYLGEMLYHLVATPEFITGYFKGGVNAGTLMNAPKVIYGENDNMHEDFISKHFRGYSRGKAHRHFVPSPQGIVEFALSGLTYALLPQISIKKYLDSGVLVNLSPHMPYRLKLFWHAQDLQTNQISKLCNAIITHARKVLEY